MHVLAESTEALQITNRSLSPLPAHPLCYLIMASTCPEKQLERSPAFVSLGMVVLDELQFPSRETLYDVPGGSGAYSRSRKPSLVLR